MSKLLLGIPLAILAILGFIGVLGVSEDGFGVANIGGDTPDDIIYYDSTGHSVSYANLTAVDERGWYYKTTDGYLGWVNSSCIVSGVVVGVYTLYWDTLGASPILYEDMGKTHQYSESIGFIDIETSLGFVALLVGISALAVVVGLRVLGSGTSEFSVSMIVGVSFWMCLWGVFSVMSLNLISELNFSGGTVPFGSILFFGMTLIYTIGVFQNAKGGGSED